MKSVIKKLFSLLLVGVVTVSMFGFVKPNCVEAIEANDKSETIHILNMGGEDLLCITQFFLEDDPELTKSLNPEEIIEVCPGKGLRVSIDPEAKFVQIKINFPNKHVRENEKWKKYIFAQHSNRSNGIVDLTKPSIIIRSFKIGPRVQHKSECFNSSILLDSRTVVM